MEKTDRVFLVGAGARRFATVHGFADEELLTEKTRKIWLHWKDRLSDLDDWIEAARDAEDPDVKLFLEKYGRELFRPQGTIHMSVRSARGTSPASRRPPASSSRSPDASETPPSSAPASIPRTESVPPVRQGGARRTSSPAGHTPSSSTSGAASPPRKRACAP